MATTKKRATIDAGKKAPSNKPVVGVDPRKTGPQDAAPTGGKSDYDMLQDAHATKHKADPDSAAAPVDMATALPTAAATIEPPKGMRRKKVDDLEDRVTVTIPRDYILTLDGHREVRYRAGIAEMPRSHAEDSYSVACGVEIYEPK